jgi:preprotein translocase subunit Sec61beta
MSSEKVSLPSGGAGITRYFEESKSKITIQPGVIVILAVIVCILVGLLHILTR